MKGRFPFVVVRVVLGFIFVCAAVGKIADPAAFACDVDNYRLLPYLAVTLTAAVLPWLELLCGVSLIIGRWTRGSALLVAVMLVAFLAGLISALARGLDIDCGCFTLGSEASKVSLHRVLEDVVMLAAALWIWRREESAALARASGKSA
ncbi:MAG: DoxX family membrane protein [Calditrichaeota bacterium]|nr:DoxX family membrane protein [Calditrichota bacterium]